ncbi:hypothetical protein CsSME_00048506 [Camellia sinensis var. sinensis]
MADETQKPAAPETSVQVTEEVVVVSDVPVAEKELPPAPEPEPEATPEKPPAAAAAAEEEVVEAEKSKPAAEEEKITESASFKEETNVVGELPDPQKKALDELKQLVQEALNKHEFTALPPPPPPPAVVEEEKKAEEAAPETPGTEEPSKPEEVPAETSAPAEEVAAPPKEVVVAVAEVVEKVTAVIDDDGAKTVEAIEETIVAVSAPAPPPEEAAVATEAPPEEPKEEESAPPLPPPPPEEVSIYGIPLLADERSDVILLKFLRARDFKVKEAFTMLKNTVLWRKDFGIESLVEEDLGTELDKVVFMHGFDKEGHPVCYNAYGEFQNKDLYHNTFSDEEKRQKFIRWRIQFLEKSIRKLDFSPDGICTFVQVNDLKNSPGPFKRELRTSTNQALQLLQDNYPEFVAKQV